ncbi:protease Do-like 2 [Corchorus capsularis]|uniref:Protease Do-like 2 n=1 Tax=Corchorus capsularis TaxID=210143 RepID=A0A1R3K3M3_COCAP|nr:protease Do-like 2 [Corchorus capsularis]
MEKGANRFNCSILLQLKLLLLKRVELGHVSNCFHSYNASKVLVRGVDCDATLLSVERNSGKELSHSA